MSNNVEPLEPVPSSSDVTEANEVIDNDVIAEIARDEEKIDTEDGPTGFDYAELAKQDLEELQRDFPELSGITSLTQLSNPLRFAALRDLGLSAREAYLATEQRRTRADNRRHLRSSVPGSCRADESVLCGASLEAARELFGGLSDREIQKLYKKVIK